MWCTYSVRRTIWFRHLNHLFCRKSEDFSSLYVESDCFSISSIKFKILLRLQKAGFLLPLPLQENVCSKSKVNNSFRIFFVTLLTSFVSRGHVFLNKYSAIFLWKLVESNCFSKRWTSSTVCRGNLKLHHDMSWLSKSVNGSLNFFKTSSNFTSIRSIFSKTGFNFLSNFARNDK